MHPKVCQHWKIKYFFTGGVDGTVGLFVAASGQRGEDGHGGFAVFQQTDIVQSTSGPRGHSLSWQPV